MGKYFDLKNVDVDAVTSEVQNTVPEASYNDVDSFIDADWPNAAEHQEWLNEASTDEIADWVASVLVNTHPSMVNQ